jgi:hypothetical protein
MKRRFLIALLDSAPVLLAVVAMVAAFLAVFVTLPTSSLRDSLTGAIVGGLVTLVTTIAVQDLQARAEHRRVSEDQARQEVRVIGSLARELAKAGAFVTAMTEGESRGILMLLPSREWGKLEVELGGFWHPHDVADLSLIYHQIDAANEVLVALGAPAEGTRSTAIDLPSDVVTYLQRTRDQANGGVAKLNRRGDVLQRRHGWPARARPDWP